MKYLIRIFFLIVLPAALISCEKTIQLRPAENEDKYVIEGTITNQPGTCSVLISKMKNFNDDNTYGGLSKAIVEIENNGNVITLPETSSGVYTTSAVNGTPGQTYRLKVTIDGKQFTSVSTMPDPVQLEDFYMKPADFDTLSTIAYVKYKDPAEVKNYYWFELFINDKKQRNYDLSNDDFTTRQVMNSPLIFENTTENRSKDLKKGDKLGVRMHCIDAPVYLYLFTLTNADGAGEGSYPANPISNITGGALGYFSAHTVQSKELLIR